MENEDLDPDYEIEEIILTLEAIKEHGSGSMNPWKALLCLAKEIFEIKRQRSEDIRCRSLKGSNNLPIN